MARREVITIRLTDDGINQLDDLAEDETDGNRSEMIRRLIREALAIRTRGAPARDHFRSQER